MLINVDRKRSLSEKQQYLLQGEMELMEKSTVIAYVWLFFAGLAGMHRFYLDHKFSAWAQLLVTTISVIIAAVLDSIFPLVISLAWWIVDWLLTAEMVRERNKQIEKTILLKLTKNTRSQT